MLLLVILLFTGAYASPVEDCIVGEWGDWSECTVARSCPRLQDYNPVTHKLAAAHWDEGREWMLLMMQRKQQHFESRRTCVENGGCQELLAKRSSGPVPCVDGNAGEYPCRNIDQLSFVSHEDLGPENSRREGNDVWGWYDKDENEEYAIMGLTDGTSFVRMTNPEAPEVLAFLPSAGASSTWRDIKVVGDFAYIISEALGHGMQVVDMQRLRSMNAPYVVIEEDAHYPGSNSHNIVSNEDTQYVYIVGATRSTPEWLTCEGGLHAVDVSDPNNPRFAGCFDTDGYVHDAECVIYTGPDDNFRDQEVCFCYNEDTLTIVNVDDKENMYLISKMAYEGHQYTHQGWLTPDHTVLLLDDELDEVYTTDKKTKTFIWDITSLSNPVLKTVFRSSEDAIDHNQYILGDYTYQSNYEAGLRILHVDKENFDLNEVAYFDVFPSRTTAEFAGTWSNYPYLPSGNIPLSSIEFGLFIVKADMDAMNAASKTMHAEKHRSRDLLTRTTGSSCPPIKESQKCGATC